MRKRTTWQQSSPTTSHSAATRRQADVYTMNQDHKQPDMESAYESGSPDSWAETPATDMPEKTERNELGLAEFSEKTWKHKDSEEWNDGKKYDNARQAAERKALAATKLASALLPGASAEAIADQSFDLMGLSSRSIAASLRRLEDVARKSRVAATPRSKVSTQRRALACVKLARRILASTNSEQSVEQLGRTFMALSDQHLRSILSQIRTADEMDKEEKKDPETAGADCDEPGALTADEKMALDSLVVTPALEVTEAPAAPVLEAPAAPAAEAPVAPALLDELFVAPPSMDLASEDESSQEAPATTAGSFDISFDDGEEAAELASLVSGAVSLDQLFSDNPEVIAQREIQAASDEAFRQEMTGFQPVRQASAGARKIGNVKVTSAPQPKSDLSKIWED